MRAPFILTNNTFIHPGNGWLARTCNWLANCQPVLATRRAILSRLPFVTLESDVVEVVYLNWLVPCELAAPHVPPGVTLYERNGQTILTVLTYRHGHFGPAFLGPLRKLFPSPLQSNWRFYLEPLQTGQNSARHTGPCVLFIKNSFDSLLYTLITRLCSDALPSHLAASLMHAREGNRFTTELKGGHGSAPDLYSKCQIEANAALPPQWQAFFADWREAIAYLTLQESAIAQMPGTTRLAQAGIDLPIPQDQVMPLACTAYSPGELLTSLGASGEPFCFTVPKVKFKVLWETVL